MKRVFHLQSGETAVIFRRNFSSMGGAVSFTAATAEGGAPRGEVLVKGSNWIFPKPTDVIPLASVNSVKQGFWDTFFSISVHAEQDLTVTLP